MLTIITDGNSPHNLSGSAQSTDGPRINVSAEKNTKGYNFSATVVNAISPGQALALLKAAVDGLKLKYGAI